jgi:catechol 2,3-dioxygenase-like lactoylglutathione lyase family enzyme
MRTVFNHLGHCVTDLERSRRFYEEALGLEFWRDLEAPDEMTASLLGLPAPVGLKAVYLRKGDFVLELLYYAGAGTNPYRERVMNDIGLTHISMSVDDIDATAAKVVEHGGTVLESTHVGAAVMVRDPDGQLIELLPMAYHDNLPD